MNNPDAVPDKESYATWITYSPGEIDGTWERELKAARVTVSFVDPEKDEADRKAWLDAAMPIRPRPKSKRKH